MLNNLKYGFYRKNQASNDQYFELSSRIELIGYKMDRKIKNNANIRIMSEPIDIYSKKYGYIQVVKIMTEKDTMWCLNDDVVCEN